jgi:hypothetical protein
MSRVVDTILPESAILDFPLWWSADDCESCHAAGMLPATLVLSCLSWFLPYSVPSFKQVLLKMRFPVPFLSFHRLSLSVTFVNVSLLMWFRGFSCASEVEKGCWAVVDLLSLFVLWWVCIRSLPLMWYFSLFRSTTIMTIFDSSI